MKILLIFSLVTFSLALTDGGFKSSPHQVKGMLRQLARKKCTSLCKEKSASCSEYRNRLSTCETMKQPVYERGYNTGFTTCEESSNESPIACSYEYMRSTYEAEGVYADSDDFFNEFVDSLEETNKNY